jgi:hypothetical protein
MAYSKVSNKTQDKDVKYLNKDFNSYKNQLMEFAEVYFPDNFNDFSEGNPGMMFLEMAAYVGDVLSFYTDTQLRESFLSLAQEKENLYNMAYAMGYKPRVTAASNVNLDVFQLVPAKGIGGIGTNNYIPDFDYALNISPNTTFNSIEGPKFYLKEQVNFNYSSSLDPTDISIYSYDNNNKPTYFLLKKTGKALSGEIKTQTFTIGAAEKFKTLELFDDNIISIESIVDGEGNKWYEVPYLAQDTIFDEVENTAATDPELKQYNGQTPYLIKLKKSTRRFITRFKINNQLEIQFGAGNSNKADEEIIPNPDSVGLGIDEGVNRLNVAYDPSNFLFTKAYGQAPANTTLTITYIVGGGLESNVQSNTITEIDTLLSVNKPNLNSSLLSYIKTSITVNNSEAATGGGAGDSIEDIRLNAMANFSTQQRTVTKNDYIIRTLSLPSKFGRVTKAYITQDDQISPLLTVTDNLPNPLALNLHTLGYDSNKNLTTLNKATKTNLATYLEQYRMLADAINIKDAFVINFSLDFEITTFKTYSNDEVLLECISELKNYFDIDKWQINQPIIISEISNLIAGVKGVQTVEKVELENKNGLSLGYSQYKYDFKNATKKNVIYPSMDPSIFELKYPNTDINGRVTTY